MRYDLCGICETRDKRIQTKNGSVRCSERSDRCPGFKPGNLRRKKDE